MMDDKTNDAACWQRRFWLLLAVLLVVRLLYLWLGPLDLDPDEAYYWDWSRQLAWGYYSKPPLVAWIIALSTHLLGVAAFTVRLPAALLGLGTAAGLYVLGRRMFSPRAGWLAAALFALTPAEAASGYFMTTDALLVCCWVWTLVALQRAVRQGGGWWLLAGIGAGLGLMSKQMMGVFLLLTLLWLLTDSEVRGWLRRPGPWLMLLVAGLFLVPGMVWNAHHDWITFQHTASTVERPLGGLATLGDFVGSQLLLFSPLACALLFALGAILVAAYRRQPSAIRQLLWFSVSGLTVFVLLSLKQKINANWAGTFYPAGFVLLAGWFDSRVVTGTRLDRWRTLARPALWVAGVCSLLLYAAPPAYDALGLSGGHRDPLAKRRGWAELGRQVGGVAGTPTDRPLLIALSRMYAAEMAFYVPGHPVATRWVGRRAPVTSQYEIWGVDRRWRGHDALILIQEGEKLPAELAACFERVVPLPPLEVPVGRAGHRHFTLVRGEGLRDWRGW